MCINPFAALYGPGVINDVPVAGYGVTKFPIDLNTFWSLPNRAIRNFGGSTQYVTYPMGYPLWMYNMARNFTSPNFTSQWNPMNFGMTGINVTGSMPNPFLTQSGQQGAYDWGYNLGVQQQIQSAVQGIGSALNSLENGLANLVKSDDLTNAQKASLKALLEEVQTLKKKIAKQLKAKNPTVEEVADMQKEVRKLQDKVSEEIDRIRASISNGTGSSSTGTTSGTTPGGSSATPFEPSLTGTDYENIDPETGRPTSLGEAPSGYDVSKICSAIHGAVSGSGTKNEELETAINALNENNIVEVIANWEKSWGKHTETGNNGFFARIFDDIGDDDQRKYVPIMLDALVKRAEALGISEEVQTYADAVLKELHNKGGCGMWSWTDDHILANNLMEIYKKIVEKEASNKTGAKEELKNQEEKHKEEVDKHRDEVKTEKINEFAQKLKEELKLSEVPQLASGLTVETDDNGDFTGYSIELDTQNGKVKFTGQTYHELVLAIEKQGLKVEDVLIRSSVA